MIEFRSTFKGEREFMRKEIEGVAYDTSNSTVDKNSPTVFPAILAAMKRLCI